jgi:hypothetical protein
VTPRRQLPAPPPCSALHFTALHYNALNCTAIQCTKLHRIALRFLIHLFAIQTVLRYEPCLVSGRDKTTLLHWLPQQEFWLKYTNLLLAGSSIQCSERACWMLSFIPEHIALVLFHHAQYYEVLLCQTHCTIHTPLNWYFFTARFLSSVFSRTCIAIFSSTYCIHSCRQIVWLQAKSQV